jgi:hypothetical protein
MTSLVSYGPFARFELAGMSHNAQSVYVHPWCHFDEKKDLRFSGQFQLVRVSESTIAHRGVPILDCRSVDVDSPFLPPLTLCLRWETEVLCFVADLGPRQ